MDNFVHLHLHTEYSFLDGMSKVWDTPSKEKGDLIKRLEEIQQPMCAITDHGSTAGWVRFDKACKSGNIKPIFGVEGYYCNNRKVKGLPEEQKIKVVRGLTNPKAKREAVKAAESILGLNRRSHFVALAMNETGLFEIQKTLTIAATEGFYYRPRWDWDLIEQMPNCIFLTACAGGIINYHLKVDDPDNGDYDKAYEEAEKWKKMLGDRFYIELQAIDYPKGARIEKSLYKIAKALGIPMVITNDSHYVYAEDWESHDILLALQSSKYDELGTKDILNDPNRMRYDMQDLFVKNRKEMFSSFMKHHKWVLKKEVSEMLDRTVEIGERCHHDIIKKKMIMPVLKAPKVKGLPESYDGYSSLERYFWSLIWKGWKRKIIPYVEKGQHKLYRARLKEEADHIIKQGFTPYFILCYRMMKWVDQQGIARGPARGSSAGSLIAYLLDITMIDPIPHNLLFSRFIDPNRTDFPDIDMDFEDVRRHEVVQYFIDTYGQNMVAMLGNNNTFKAKMALKDVARLYMVNVAETQRICDLVVERSGADSRLSFCLEDTFNQFPFAQEYKQRYPQVVRHSQKLEGLTKTQGVHAAGVVIADGDIAQYTACRPFDRNSNFRVTFMDKHDAEDIGILKMDILGLNTMGIIKEAQKLIKARHNVDVDLEELCRDVTYGKGCEKVFEEFSKGNTVGIFQFGSPGLTRLSKQMKIDKFSEISDATALHRPGPIHSGAMNNYPAYKFGKAKKSKPIHPIIEKWTKPTYGLIIYQEQVMQIVRELGGFDWAQTNTVRKVMSKSGGAEYFMKTFWPTWKEGCAKHGLDDKVALKAFHKIMSFGSWAFNLCVSKDTLILNTNPNQFAPKWITVEQLFDQQGYATAKALENPSCYVKMNTLGIDGDVLRPNKIGNVFYKGKQKVWKITLEDGKSIKATSGHRFLLRKPDGTEVFCTVKNLEVGDMLAVNGGYVKKDFRKGTGKGWRVGRSGGAGDSIDNRSKEVLDFKEKMEGEVCEADGCRELGREVHHETCTPSNSILKWLCSSCHKKRDYELGRTKVWENGFVIGSSPIVSIEYAGIEDTYDIEMEDSSRPTFVANGFVSHNSHSVAYAMVSYMCMWFKVNYPIEYITAYLNVVNDTTGDKLKEMMRDAERLRIPIRSANINYSKDRFTIHGDAMICGLSDIKHIGDKARQAIVANQPYKGLLDFLNRIDRRACNKRVIENLVIVGAFDDFYYNKKKLMEVLPDIIKFSKQKSPASKVKLKELLKSCKKKGQEEFTDQQLAEKKQAISPLVLGKHIVEYYDDVVETFGKHIKITKLAEIEQDEGKQQSETRRRKEVWVMGLLTAVDLKRLSQEVKEIIDSIAEQRYALANLEDETDFIVLSFKNQAYTQYEQKLFPWKNKVLLINGEVNEGWKKLYVNKVIEVDELRKYILNKRKPFNFDMDSLIEHPLIRYFKKTSGGVQGIRRKCECTPLRFLVDNQSINSAWCMGLVTGIQTRITKKEEFKGQEMYIVTFEDETFAGSFMLWPGDPRFSAMKKDVFEAYEKRIPIELYVQRDYKFKPEDAEYKHVNISLDKRLSWKKLIRKRFVFNEKKEREQRVQD